MTRSPALLVGAGTGEATCGILYLASYLRRGGIEAYVRLYDGDETDEEMRDSLQRLLKRVRPKLVGISLKWFHHVHRALRIARVIRDLDPSIRVVVGGNSASYWWRELAEFDFIDDVVLGDGDRGDAGGGSGELKLDDKLARYFPGVPDAAEISIEQLLRHESGLGSFTDDATYEQWFTAPQSRDAMLARIEKLPAVARPGSASSTATTTSCSPGSWSGPGCSPTRRSSKTAW